jgi:hypothetical protein
VLDRQGNGQTEEGQPGSGRGYGLRVALFVRPRINETNCVGVGMELWKLQRELLRFGKQVREIPEDLINYFFATRRYDRTRLDRIRMFDGKLPKSERIAIFLIFPKTGLLQSHLHTLEYFRSKGYATLVVSNLPLSDIDRKRLSESSWQIMERPNFGYDFGGYRDGVLSLSEDLALLERLVLINDSVWFPLPKSRDWLDDVETLGVDFAGASSNYGTPRLAIEKFRSTKWSYSTNHKNFHICSFALCLKPAVLRHFGFQKFWQDLRLTDEKKRTVRRGEIGFTQWALRNSLSVGTTLDVTKLDCELAALSETNLRDYASNLIILEHPRLSRLWQDLIENPITPRQDFEKLILLAVSLQGSSYSLAAYSIQEKGFSFLKKSPLRLSEQGRNKALSILEKIGLVAED